MLQTKHPKSEEVLTKVGPVLGAAGLISSVIFSVIHLILGKPALWKFLETLELTRWVWCPR